MRAMGVHALLPQKCIMMFSGVAMVMVKKTSQWRVDVVSFMIYVWIEPG